MAWTLQNFIVELRRRIDEYDEELYSNAELTTYINEGIQKMGLDLENQAVGEVAITNRKDVYFKEIFITPEQKLIEVIADRKHNFAQIQALYLGDEKIPLGTIEDVENGANKYYFWGDTIVFGSPKSGTLKAFYLKTPKFLTSDLDVTDIPEKYQHIPLEWAIARVKQKDGEYGLYDYGIQQFTRLVQEMKDDLVKQYSAGGVSSMNVTHYNEY